MCVWLVHRGTFVSTYCMLICVYVFGIIGHWLALLSLHRLWHWAFKEVNKCQLQPTKWNLYWAHPWFTIPALLQRKKKMKGRIGEEVSSNPTVWRKDVFVPPLTAVGRHFRTPPATITLVKPKPPHSISVGEVGCVFVLLTQTQALNHQKTHPEGLNTTSGETFVMSLLARERGWEDGNGAKQLAVKGQRGKNSFVFIKWSLWKRQWITEM